MTLKQLNLVYFFSPEVLFPAYKYRVFQVHCKNVLLYSTNYFHPFWIVQYYFLRAILGHLMKCFQLTYFMWRIRYIINYFRVDFHHHGSPRSVLQGTRDLDSGAVCQTEHSWPLWVLRSAQQCQGVLRSGQRAQERSAWHTARLSRSLVPWRTVMVMKTSSDYISYS